MSVQTEITRIAGAVSDALAAVADKGVTVPDGTKVDGLAALIASIEAGGGGGIELPTGYKVSTGSYTPNTEGTNVTHSIKIASSLPVYNPCKMFCIFREDGFNAPGSDAARYITLFVGSVVDPSYFGAGFCCYRLSDASGEFTMNAGTENVNTMNYGLPISAHSVNRTNCFVRQIETNGVLTFSTYGIVTLESGKTYKWFAILSGEAVV